MLLLYRDWIHRRKRPQWCKSSATLPQCSDKTLGGGAGQSAHGGILFCIFFQHLPHRITRAILTDQYVRHHQPRDTCAGSRAPSLCITPIKGVTLYLPAALVQNRDHSVSGLTQRGDFVFVFFTRGALLHRCWVQIATKGISNLQHYYFYSFFFF